LDPKHTNLANNQEALNVGDQLKLLYTLAAARMPPREPTPQHSRGCTEVPEGKLSLEIRDLYRIRAFRVSTAVWWNKTDLPETGPHPKPPIGKTQGRKGSSPHGLPSPDKAPASVPATGG